MAQSRSNQPPSSTSAPTLSTSVDDLLAAAQARGDEGLETGRYIVTYK
jgi:hypothetical protein